MGRVYDVMVIGATVSGLTSAIQLARRGAAVGVLDPNLAHVSASVGHGVVTVSSGDLVEVAAGSFAELERRVRGVQAAIEHVEQVASQAGVPTTRTRVVERAMRPGAELDEEARLLTRLGVRPVPSASQLFKRLPLEAGWSVADQLVVDPNAYAVALHDLAESAGVTLLHQVTVTRFRRHEVLHAVHYRRQQAWEHAMLADWAPRLIDTQATSPWGRLATTSDPLVSPVVTGRGLRPADVLSLRDAPARLMRPFGDGVLVSGHPVPPAAVETATVGLRHWLREHMGVEPVASAGFGVEPTSSEGLEGVSAIPGGFWAGGNGLWELGHGTAAGLALSQRLLADSDGGQRLPVLSRLRAAVTRKLR